MMFLQHCTDEHPISATSTIAAIVRGALIRSDLAEVGGEALDTSGFEDEAPEANFDEWR